MLKLSGGHHHAILESFIFFVFGTYLWINKQSCVILGCHKQSSEWCHDWFPISLHVPSFSYFPSGQDSESNHWADKKRHANLDGRMYGNPCFFSLGIKLPTLERPGEGTLTPCYPSSIRPVPQGFVASRNFEVQSKLPSTSVVELSAVQWFSAQKIGPSTWRCHENYRNKMEIGGPIGNAKACHEDKAQGVTCWLTQWGLYHWSWLSLVYILPQAVAFERTLGSSRILWFDVDISKIVGHSLPFHSRHSLPFASTFVGFDFLFPEPWWSEDRKTTSSIL